MKRELTFDLKQIPTTDGILKQSSYKLIELELKKLRSNEKSNLGFVHLELIAFKDETDE